MSNSLSSLCSSTRVLFTKKGAVIKKAMLAAAVVSLAGLGLCLWFFTRLFNFSARWRLPLIPRQSKTNDA